MFTNAIYLFLFLNRIKSRSLFAKISLYFAIACASISTIKRFLLMMY